MWLHRSGVSRGRGGHPSVVRRAVWFSERVSHFGLVGWEGERSDSKCYPYTHADTHTHIDNTH